MPGTLTITDGFSYNHQLDDDPLIELVKDEQLDTQELEWSGSRHFKDKQNIGTTYEALSLGGVTTVGSIARFKNLDSTNYVEIGKEIAGPAFDGFCRLGPGLKSGWIPLSSVSLFGRANTAAVDLEIEVIEGPITL